MIVNASAKDIKCALFQHVRGLLFIPFHSLPSFSLINLCLLGLWPTSYGLENKPLGNKQASGRLLHFSLSSRRAQVMCRCCPNQFCFFIQKAGSGHRLLFNIFTRQIPFDEWKYLPRYLEDNGLVFKKYLVQMQTPLITIFFPMIHSLNKESTMC